MDEEQTALIPYAAGKLATGMQVLSSVVVSLGRDSHGCMELDQFDAVPYRFVRGDSLRIPFTCSLRSGPTQCFDQVGQRLSFHRWRTAPSGQAKRLLIDLACSIEQGVDAMDMAREPKRLTVQMNVVLGDAEGVQGTLESSSEELEVGELIRRSLLKWAGAIDQPLVQTSSIVEAADVAHGVGTMQSEKVGG
jgi:hypothetical protein